MGMVVCFALIASRGLADEPPPAAGPFETQGEYMYVGGFQSSSLQDIYLIYPTGQPETLRLPFVVFSHGAFKHSANDTANDYNAVLRNVASHGIVVAAYTGCLVVCGDTKYANDQL